MVNNGRTFLENSLSNEGNIDVVMAKKDLPISNELNQNFTIEELRRVKAFHGYFRGYISDVIYLTIRVFVSHKGIDLD